MQNKQVQKAGKHQNKITDFENLSNILLESRLLVF